MIATNQAHTTGNDVVIGEIVTYQVTLTIPEGTMHKDANDSYSTELRDALDSGLVLVDNSYSVVSASPALTYDSPTISVTNNGQNLVFDFGQLTNSDTDNSTAETIVIQYQAVVTNTNSNQAGQQLDNQAQLYFYEADGTAHHVTAQSPHLTVVEPELTITKTVSDSHPDAGDQVDFTITVENTGSVTAFDLTLVDIMPNSGLDFLNNLSITDENGNTVSWTGPNGANVPDDFFGSSGITLNDSGGSGLDQVNGIGLDPGDKVFITFSAKVDQNVAAGQDLTNAVALEWESLDPDDQTYSSFSSLAVERTGDDRPGGTDTDPGEDNDYHDLAQAVVSVAEPVILKSIIHTSQPHTTGNDVVIGEIVTYQVQVTLSEGYTYGAVLVDELDPGLALVGVESISSNSNDLTSTVTGGVIGTDPDKFVDPANTGSSRLWMDFGTIHNANTDNTTDEIITVTYEAVVLNADTVNRGDTLGNTVTASWDHDNNPSTPAHSVTASAPDLTVCEPELAVNKTASPHTGDAGDTITFTLDIAHTGTSDADGFDVVLNDQLPAGMTYVAGSLALVSGPQPTEMNFSNGSVTVTWDSFTRTDNARIEFQATLDQDVLPLSEINNQATITWESLPDDFNSSDTSDDLSPYNTLSQERTGNPSEIGGTANDYSAMDTALVTVPDLQIDKSGTGQYTIGDTVTFTITATLPEGTVPDLVVTDILPQGLVIDNPTLGGDITISADSGIVWNTNPNIQYSQTPGDDTLTIDFDPNTLVTGTSGTANNQIHIQVTARVENIAANEAGDTLTNQASLTYTSAQGERTLNPVSSSITLVEPALTAGKTMYDALDQGGSGGGPGDTTADAFQDVFQVEATFTNSGASDAYSIVIRDDLAPGTILAQDGSGNYQIEVRDDNGTVLSGYSLNTDMTDPSHRYFEIDLGNTLVLAPGETVYVDYQFEVLESWFVPGSYQNLIDVDWAGQPANTPDSRIYDDTDSANPGYSQDQPTTPLSAEADRASAEFTVLRGDGEMGDFIFYDLDNDQNMDVNTDVGIPGVSVTAAITVAGQTYTATSVTDSSGQYLFTHLQAATYTVAVDQSTLPSGAIAVYESDASLDNAITLTVPGTGQNLDGDFGYTGPGSLGDYLWLDLDGDGQQNEAGMGINGATVQLAVDLDGDGTVDYTTTTTTGFSPTGEPGYYRFDNLLLSESTVTVTSLPGGLGNYTQTADPDTTLDHSSTVTVGDWNADADKVIDDLDFGYRGGGRIGDRVWDDLDADRIQDATEPGLAGVRVFISGVDLNNDGTPDTLSTLTGADGSYLFTGLPAGTYTIRVDSSTLPAGYIPSYDPQWMSTDGLNHQTSHVLGNAESFLDGDFGYTQTGSIGDTIWFDANGNGLQDPGEPGLSGVSVTLTGDTDLDGITDTVTVTTDAAGHYQFGGLPLGTYTLSVDPLSLPGGMIPTHDLDGTASPHTTQVSLNTGQDRQDADFGYTGTGSIGDTVWRDSNRNGVQEGNEGGLGGVDVILQLDLDGDGQVDYTTRTTTDGQGNYLFSNLPAGDYRIVIDTGTIPGGMIPTYDPDGGGDSSVRLTLSPGQLTNLDQDFGYEYPAPVSTPPRPPVSPTSPPAEPPVTGPVGDPLLFHDYTADATPTFADQDLTLPYRLTEIDYTTPPVPVSPVYTGHAEPGTTLILSLYDHQGNAVGYQTVMADAAGNWLASFPGTLLFDHPDSMAIEQVQAPYNASTSGLFNTRVYFNPVFSTMIFTSVKADVETIFAYLPSTVLASQHAADNTPFPIRWDDFEGYEFLSPSINPSTMSH